MHFHVLAADYDGTLACDGQVDDETIRALKKLKETGRKIVLVTGRTMGPLLGVFPQIGLCDYVVAENGALLYNPATEEYRALVEPPPADFITALAARGVPPLEIGHAIVATWTPHETAVLETIRDQALELQIIFNKGAVMVLPTGVNKATGLREALLELGLSAHNTVGVGDAENDEAFLRFCDTSAAVGNALDVVKARADVVLRGARGRGVTELIDRLIETDLADVPSRAVRGIQLGTYADEREFRVPVYRTRMLIIGESGGGKSKLANSIVERLHEEEYQTCIIDPEGDYQSRDDVVVLGTREKTPSAEEVLQVVADPTQSCVVSLFATPTDEQPPVFAKLMRALMEHRSHTGRPHWYLIDEAHYPIPAVWKPVEDLNLDEMGSVLYVTAFPDRLPKSLLDSIDLCVSIADDPIEPLRRFSDLIAVEAPLIAPSGDSPAHRALAWWRKEDSALWFEPAQPKSEHQRHRHSYLDGDMDPPFRFYFRGPENELNLPVQNLRTFMDLGEGVNDETWTFHLRRGDYAQWFEKVIKDSELAGLAVRLQDTPGTSPSESRRQLFDFIRKRYDQDV